MKFITLPERIDQLVAQHGSLRKAARAIHVDVGYLSKMRAGIQNHPGAEVIEKLGLTKHRLYTRK